MADINIERKRRSPWPLLLLLLLVAAVAVGAWLYFRSDADAGDTLPAAEEQTEYTPPAQVTPVDTGAVTAPPPAGTGQ